MKDTLAKERDEEIAKKAHCKELLAAGEYAEDLTKAKDQKLRKILKRNQKDELEDHAAKLEGYVREEEAKKKVRY